MKLLLSGMNGTVAPRLAAHARRAGHEVVAWNRDEVSPDDPEACLRYLDQVRPDGIAHLAFGAEAWAALLARAAAERAIPMLYTSTSMVFAQRPDGPYDVASPRTGDSEYGRYKIRCEDAVREADPRSMIARLGYQIDPSGEGNTMVAHLDSAARRGEAVAASTRWIPACAFLADTADALLGLLLEPEPGIHHLDGNAVPGWTYHRIVTRLAAALGREWRIVATEEPDHDQRLAGSDRIAPIDVRLA